MAVSVVSALLFGIVPAWHASAEDASTALKDQARSVASSSGEARWRRVFVVVEIALCVILLAGAGLFGKSLSKLLNHNPGFHTENLLTFTLEPGLHGYTAARAESLYREMAERLAHSPGVRSASYSAFAPFSNNEAGTTVTVEGYRATEDEKTDAGLNSVAPDYFRTLGESLLSGREFDERDTAASPKVAVVNQAFARRFAHGHNPVGLHMAQGGGDVPLNVQIVGLVSDAQLSNLRQPAKPMYFMPFSQSAKPTEPALPAGFLIRSCTVDRALPSAIRELVRASDASLPVTNMDRVEVQIENSVYQDRALAILTEAAGVVALLLASLGLYGVIAYAIGRRTAEIGIRMALGADRTSVVVLVLKEMFGTVAAGILVGVIGAFALTHAIAS